MDNNFLKTVTTFFTPPIFDDEEKSRRARFLLIMLQSMSGLIIIALIIPFLIDPNYHRFAVVQSYFFVAVIGANFILIGLIRRGHVTATGLGLSTVTWLVIAIGSIYSDGIMGPTFPYFLVVILITGFVTNTRISFVLAILSVIYGIILTQLQAQGWHFKPPAPIIPETTLFAFVPGFLIVPLLVYLHQHSFQELLSRIQRTEAEKRAAEIYQIRNQELQQEIGERKRVENALLKAKEEAEIASQAKSDFLSNMSHELRTPLNGVIGYTQILQRDTTLSSSQQQAIETISQSGHHLLALINDILDIARIEARRLDLHPTAFQINPFLENIVHIISERAEQKGLAFHFDTVNMLPDGVLADETRLRQVLINLLGNAVKFTPTGSVALRVTCLPQETAVTKLTQLRFEVIDSGIGIVPADQEKIFEPFEQIQSRQKNSQGGTGLGLAISQKLVQAMSSQIHLQSKPGSGSRFWFDLLLPIVNDADTGQQPAKPPIIGYQGQRRTILVADDIAQNRSLLLNLLQPLGFAVLSARNGHEAITLAQQQHPDIILMDLVMPEMNGWEATQAIRGFDEHCIIIAVSADAFEQQKIEAIRHGCNAFLSKPVLVDPLLDILAAYGNIEWVYETAVSDPTTTALEPIIPPPAAELEPLYQMALMGNLLGIQTASTTPEKQNGRFVPFYNHVTQLAEAFEEEALIDFLEKWQQDI